MFSGSTPIIPRCPMVRKDKAASLLSARYCSDVAIRRAAVPRPRTPESPGRPAPATARTAPARRPAHHDLGHKAVRNGAQPNGSTGPRKRRGPATARPDECPRPAPAGPSAKGVRPAPHRPGTPPRRPGAPAQRYLSAPAVREPAHPRVGASPPG
ncbi:hypothetical protein GCM10017688_59020 [Streptomyces ramulosus]